MTEVRELEQSSVSQTVSQRHRRDPSSRQCDVTKHRRIASQNCRIVAQVEKIVNTS